MHAVVRKTALSAETLRSATSLNGSRIGHGFHGAHPQPVVPPHMNEAGLEAPVVRPDGASVDGVYV